MRTLAMAALVSTAVWGCGGDEPAKPPRKAGPTVPVAAGPGAPGMPGAGFTAQLVLRAKVENRYRKELNKSDFDPDSNGDSNRNPFLSYLVNPTPTATAGVTAVKKDECENRTVAGNYAYSELHLIGIVVRGSKSFAMFSDPAKIGQIAYQGDCLSKDKARIIEITPSCVRVEIRGEAPPGAPAPAAQQDKNCLHKDDIEIE
jgi:hypothetical protein